MLKDEDIKLPALPRSHAAIAFGESQKSATPLYSAEQMHTQARAAVRMNFPMPAPGLCYSVSGNIPGFGGICIHAESAERAHAAFLHLQGPATPAPQPRPFDLEAAKAGAPLVTRDGRKVHFFAHDAGASPHVRILARIDGAGHAFGFHDNGTYSGIGKQHRNDLFMAPKPTRTLYTNIYQNRLFESADDARKRAAPDCIATVPVEIDA